jgi:ABC-2 type transport system permease protein
MKRAITVEMLKVRRSPVVAATSILIVVLVPALCLGFVAVAENGGTGAIALKAQAMVVGEGWSAYTSLLGQMMAVTLFLGPGVVTAWAFGREFSDRTFDSLFAMTVSRGSTATAKYVVLIAWGAALTVVLLAVAVLVGLVTSVGPIEMDEVVPQLGRLAVTGFLTTMIATTVGLVASVGRGYLPAIGAIILLTMAAQVAVLFGTGAWFPYAAPGLYAVAGTDAAIHVDAVQLLLVPIVTGIVAWITVRWWDGAEAV